MATGARAGTAAVAGRLRELVPELGVDYNVLASALIESVDLAAVRSMDERQVATEECIQKLMAMYGSMLDTMRERIAALEAERTDLHLQVAKHATAVDPEFASS